MGMTNSFKKSIIIVDDHPIMRKGLVSTLEAEHGYEVTRQFEKAEELLKTLNELEDLPDLIIADVSLPGMNGIELVKSIIFQFPEQLILVISRHEESLYAERALRAGAKGYIMKFEPSDVFLKAVRKVLNGSIYVSEEINEKAVDECHVGEKNGYPISGRNIK